MSAGRRLLLVLLLVEGYLCEGQLVGQSHPLFCQQLLLIFIENQLLYGLLGGLRRLLTEYTV